MQWLVSSRWQFLASCLVVICALVALDGAIVAWPGIGDWIAVFAGGFAAGYALRRLVRARRDLVRARARDMDFSITLYMVDGLMKRDVQ